MASGMGDSENVNDPKAVYLYIYDMSKGMASTFSPFLLGKQIPAIWHTGIVVYNKEYYFGSAGIECIEKGQTILGEPDKILRLGNTEVPYNVFNEYLSTLNETSFTAQSYDLFEHNCNNFSQEIATFLTSKSIPQEILDLPKEVLNTPLGMVFKGIMSNSNVGHNLFSFTPNAPNPISGQNSTCHSSSSGDSGGESNNVEAATVALIFSELERQVPLNESHVLNLIHQYINSQVPALDLKSEHLDLLDKLLHSSDNDKINLTLTIIAKASLKKDFYEVLNLDKNEPKLMKGLKKVFDEGSVKFKTSVLELLCNLTESDGLDWVNDKSRPAWIEESTNKAWTHRSATVAMIVAGLLGSNQLHQTAIKLTHILTSRIEELEEEATEITTAILQCLQNSCTTERYTCMALESILSLMNACPSEVPGLVLLMGLDLSPLSRQSPRLSMLVSQIQQTSSFYLN